MGKAGVEKTLEIEGMTCASCELRLENGLKKIKGVSGVKASLAQAKLYVTFDPDGISLPDIMGTIEKIGYKAFENTDITGPKTDQGAKTAGRTVIQFTGVAVVLLALHIIITNTVGYNFIPAIDQSMGYGILFIVGLLTSVHCIAMCGGINLSQCMSYKHFDDGRYSRLKPSFLYNAGRVVSYTVIGGIVGALGSVLSFSGMARGLVSILAGVFMVIMGLNMLNLFPWLKRLNPRMPKLFGNKIYGARGSCGPFYIGLLNGLMPCGPLQAMQLYALGTGSFFAGAASMFIFSAGTVPLLFGFGALSSVMSKKFTGTLMKVSAVLVMVLGMIMLGRGLGLSGIALPGLDNNVQYAQIEGNVQIVSVEVQSDKYAPVVVQKGIPVRFILKAEASNLNGCNNIVIIPKYNKQQALQPGENIIEFTPQETGSIPYSCHMGMIKSSIQVVDDIAKSEAEAGK